MDKHTQNLKNMIGRMIELDTPEQQKQQLDEMASMNVSMSGDSADDVASLMKILQNAGVNDKPAQSAPTMPMRQDMERLSSIMGDPEPAQPGEQESLEEWSDSDADTLALLHGKVQSAANGDRRAAAQFEDYVDNNFPHVNSEELLAKLVKMDDSQQFDTLHDMISSEYRNDSEDDYTDQSMRRGEMGEVSELDEWSSTDASEMEQLSQKAAAAMKGDRRAASQFQSYVSDNFGVDGKRFLMKLGKLDRANQAEALQKLIRGGRKGSEVGKSDQGIRRTQMQFNSANSGELVSSCCEAPLENVDGDHGRCTACGEMASAVSLEGYDNSPDEDYQDAEYMTKDLSGGLNRQKKQYAKAQDGDNAMAVESIKDRLYAKLSEKKAKPDFADIDGDGDKKEPMKKAAKDKKKK